MNEKYLEQLDSIIQYWVADRAEKFKNHGLVLEEVYESGDFLGLPPECLMSVCYVDAWKSAKHNFESLLIENAIQ